MTDLGVVAVFLDARGPERALRVSRHEDADVVVLNLWRGPACVASFRIPTAEAHRLASALLCQDSAQRPDR